MRKLLFLLLIVPLSVSAKFYKATVTFNDGTTKNGFVELPEYPDDAKLKFRSEEKGKTEKLEIDSVKGFEIINDKNVTVKYATVFLADPKPFTNVEFRLDKKKSWVRVIYEGKLKFYAAYASYSAGSGTGGASTSYVQRENDQYAYFITYGGSSGGFSINMNVFSTLKKCIRSIFEKDCPKLVELLDKEDIKKNGLSRISELYEQNCGSK